MRILQQLLKTKKILGMIIIGAFQIGAIVLMLRRYCSKIIDPSFLTGSFSVLAKKHILVLLGQNTKIIK